jgi:hypothetical protein
MLTLIIFQSLFIIRFSRLSIFNVELLELLSIYCTSDLNYLLSRPTVPFLDLQRKL